MVIIIVTFWIGDGWNSPTHREGQALKSQSSHYILRLCVPQDWGKFRRDSEKCDFLCNARDAACDGSPQVQAQRSQPEAAMGARKLFFPLSFRVQLSFQGRWPFPSTGIPLRTYILPHINNLTRTGRKGRGDLIKDRVERISPSNIRQVTPLEFVY